MEQCIVSVLYRRFVEVLVGADEALYKLSSHATFSKVKVLALGCMTDILPTDFREGVWFLQTRSHNSLLEVQG